MRKPQASLGAAGGGSAGVPPSTNESGARDAGAAGQSAPGEGGQAGAKSWTPDAPRALTTMAKAPEWYAKDTTQAQGLLVAPDGRVFFESTNKIYEIAGAQVSDYLTDVEAQAAVGSQDGYGFGGLGFDQQGTLYATYAGSMIRSGRAASARPLAGGGGFDDGARAEPIGARPG